jgi:hypothetical protein
MQVSQFVSAVFRGVKFWLTLMLTATVICLILAENYSSGFGSCFQIGKLITAFFGQLTLRTIFVLALFCAMFTYLRFTSVVDAARGKTWTAIKLLNLFWLWYLINRRSRITPVH